MIYFDIQHIGKPHSRNDMGASIGDKPEQTEAYWTSLYAFFAEMKLRSLGYECMRLSDGFYSSRHERVNSYASGNTEPSVYISCHINVLSSSKLLRKGACTMYLRKIGKPNPNQYMQDSPG